MAYPLSGSKNVFGNILDVDFSHGVDFGTGHHVVFPGMCIFGNILDVDFSHHHVLEDPLIKHINGNHHVLERDLTAKRTKFLLGLKSLFKRVPRGPRAPKREAKAHKGKKRRR